MTVDRTPPQITAPDVNALATGLTTPVTLAATATDTVDPSVAVTYWIGSTQIFSGHAFPLGPTTVTAKASDAVGNAATPVDFTVTVNKRAITVTAVIASKPYDGDTSSSGAPVVGGDGLAPGDAGTYVQTYDTKDVGAGKTLTPVVTITSGGVGDPGTWPGYYDVALSSVSDGAITKAGLTVTASGIDKPYDGTTEASVTLASDKLAGDTLTLSSASASFDSKDVGAAKAVNVEGIAIAGADAGNYDLLNTTTATTAAITKAGLTVSFSAADKPYDGTTAATITGASASGVVGSEDVSVDSSGASASFADKDVGAAKTVTATGFALSGADKANYEIATVNTTTAAITKAGLTVTASGIDKPYDGTDRRQRDAGERQGRGRHADALLHERQLRQQGRGRGQGGERRRHRHRRRRRRQLRPSEHDRARPRPPSPRPASR